MKICLILPIHKSSNIAFLLGLAQIESMVGDKMAKKLIDSIGDILGTSSTKKAKEKTETIIEEIILPSGEKQSRIIEGTQIDDDTIEVRSKTTTSSPNKLTEDELRRINEDEEEADEVLDHKDIMGDLSRQVKEVSDKLNKMLQKDINSKDTDENQYPDKKTISLDPRSDLSDEQ